MIFLVRAYSSDNYAEWNQLGNVIIEATTIKNNWVTNKLAISTNNGACVPVSCDSSDGDYRVNLRATNGGDESLYPADNITGNAISDDYKNDLLYS